MLDPGAAVMKCRKGGRPGEKTTESVGPAAHLTEKSTGAFSALDLSEKSLKM
jgi:hypothetical protein